VTCRSWVGVGVLVSRGSCNIPGVLEAQHLWKRFGEVAAVCDLSLTVHPGEVVGLLGPNGAGKTTTLRMLAGILTPTRGRVLVGGTDLARDPLAAKRRIGFLSGDTQLYQRLTPREMLAYFGRLYAVDSARLSRRIDDLVEQLDMAAFASRPCGTLSSGQKQRANIARAFLHEPDVLILDEPTAALDVITGQFIVESIRRERAAGRSILFSTHIMGEAEYVCDRIVLLHGGRAIDSGTLPDLLARSGCSNLTDAFLHHIGRDQRAAPSTAANAGASEAMK
jgi:sodium transport system ATP-binding protein